MTEEKKIERGEEQEEDLRHIPLEDGLVKEVEQAIDEENSALVAALTEPLHPADLADLLQLVSSSDRTAIFTALGPAFDPEVLSHLDEAVREDLLENLDTAQTSAVIAELETGDALEILADLDEEEKEAILAELPLPERAVLEQGLAFPEDSAGRLMQLDLVVVPDYWVVGQTIDYLRATPDLPEDFHDIYIVDEHWKPVGSVPLSNILRSKRGVAIHDLKMKDLHLVQAETDQEEIAFLFRQYGLVSAPVVDASGRLIGVIDIDDVVDIIHEEAEEDTLKLGGVSETDLFLNPTRTMRQRLPWLFVNLLTAVIASLVIAQFDEAIAQIVALAVLMPIVASMGGNAGTQTMTITVRSLAVRELTTSNAGRMIGKELLVGLLQGIVFVAVGFALAMFWFGDFQLAWIFAVAMLINLLAASLAGIAIPMAIDHFGADPAISSGVFLTTVTDVVGFFSFLGLAVYMLL